MTPLITAAPPPTLYRATPWLTIRQTKGNKRYMCQMSQRLVAWKITPCTSYCNLLCASYMPNQTGHELIT
jgi:hypothetical protein